MLSLAGLFVAPHFTDAASRPVYVHCWGGVGRTGTIIGCWLVMQGISGDGAIRRIAELRAGMPDSGRRSPETNEQRRLVRKATFPPRGDSVCSLAFAARYSALPRATRWGRRSSSRRVDVHTNRRHDWRRPVRPRARGVDRRHVNGDVSR